MRATSHADGAVRRLVAEFAGVHPAATVTAVVEEAARHLTGQVSPAALPELLERLARQRLATGPLGRAVDPAWADLRRLPRQARRTCPGTDGRRQAGPRLTMSPGADTPANGPGTPVAVSGQAWTRSDRPQGRDPGR